MLLENPALLKRLAKCAVQQCFRNTALEEFHAGTVPDSQKGDFSDVVVNTLLRRDLVVRSFAPQRGGNEVADADAVNKNLSLPLQAVR